ncbi:MAG: hypothetical protein ABJM65_20670 [Ascidiaceihabitans sp.]|uniref:hypothetical protein n=1 Tax=Ascidiaceihabitans sp. TaxID=1872644 RepID=UPI003299582B
MKARVTDEQIIHCPAGDCVAFYNWRRSHSALGNLTPMEFMQRKAIDKMAA